MNPSAPGWLRLDALARRPEPQIAWWFGVGLLGLTAVRLLVLWVLPLDLAGDEAYYWEWGRRLDWGYFSKPPGIGWLMALAGWVGGDTAFGLRIFAVFLGSASLGLLFLLTRRLYGSPAALWAALAFAANPANAALNVLLTIDAPLLFCWMAALYCFWRWRESDGRSLGWSVGWALALAGGLLSKQMMLVWYPLVCLCLGQAGEWRTLLRRPSLWLVLAGSSLALWPPLVWNYRHGWLTVQHTLHHFEGEPAGVGRRLGWLLEFLGSQLGLVTPGLYLLLIAVLFVSVRRWGQLEPRERFLWLFSAPGWLVMLGMCLRQRVNANWPAVFYPTAVILLTAWAGGRGQPETALQQWRRWYSGSLALALGLTAVTYGAAFALSFGWIPTGRFDPSARIRGWSRMAADVAAAASTLPPARPLIYITQSHRFLTSELAFYLPGQPRVYRFDANTGVVGSQYDLWETPAAHLGTDALVVVQGDTNQLAAALAQRFARLTPLKELHYPEQRPSYRRLTLYHGENLQRWP
jgi:4-amino-4-deoxy-L-arabinose transferase-like glycosyltransferase